MATKRIHWTCMAARSYQPSPPQLLLARLARPMASVPPHAVERQQAAKSGGSAMRTWISGGTVVTASDTYTADVLIDGEKIVSVGQGLSADTTIDARGKYVIPGGID